MSEEQQGPEQFGHDTERKLRERIEQLERAWKDLEKLSIKLLNEKLQGEWREPLENDLAETEAKLAKAVDVLREIEADCDADYPPSHGAIKYAIRAVLAELEAKNE